MTIKKIIYNSASYNHDWGNEKTYSILCGVLRFKKSSRGTQDFRVLGLRIYKRRIKNHYAISKVCCLPVYRENLRRKILNKLFSQINKKYDGVYIIRHNIGESYVYLAHLKAWVLANRTKKPLLVVWQKKYLPFYKMFLPSGIDIKYIEIDKNKLQDALDCESIEYKGRKLFCPTYKIAENLNKLYENNVQVNFYDYICKDFDLTKKSVMQKPKIDKSIVLKINKKLADNFRHPFVIILPGASSLSGMSDVFWSLLIKEFKRIGYDVFVNDINNSFSDSVCFDTNIAEIFALAERSAGIIGLASGLSVLLTAANRPMDLIYTDFRIFKPHISSARIKDFYSVHHLPNVSDKVREYDAADFTEMQLVQAIINNYKAK